MITGLKCKIHGLNGISFMFFSLINSNTAAFLLVTTALPSDPLSTTCKEH